MSESEETISTITGIPDNGMKSPSSFEFVLYPKDEDIVAGSALETIGNRKYRDIVSNKKEAYQHEPYSQRSIALDVIDEVNSSSTRSGRFLKKDSNHDAQYRVMKEEEVIKEVISDLMGKNDKIPTASISVPKVNSLHDGSNKSKIDISLGSFGADIKKDVDSSNRVEEDAARDDVEKSEEDQQAEGDTALQVEVDDTLTPKHETIELVVTSRTVDSFQAPSPKASATPSIKARIESLEKMVFGEQGEDKLLIERLVWLEKNIMENKGSATFIERLASIEFELGMSI